MKKLIVYYGDTPMCIEGFPEGCERSREGALHVLPRKNMTVTEGEYEHMLASRPEMKRYLKVVAELKDDKEEPKKEEADSQDEASSQESEEATQEEASEEEAVGESEESEDEEEEDQ